ncbi:sarcosine oxidase subunit gamma [Jannaschia formosa]|uniref:sarcosine oxidase subunit gamma n=1 Tax=Jannaschia formosa TaxID=2259592 RepID=UPI000E1B84D9|nr:sarcosine oxidase subunit gamma [Jannaschia formosa]TFL17330.1 sarcosine oxidase subunit gamma [Jannaschia formosa]
MANLIARSPAEGLLPLANGDATLSEVVPEAITSLMALDGATFPLPGPGRSTQRGGGLLLWSGRNQALLVGPRPDPIPQIAMTDQSDAWAVLRLEGPAARAVLARLTPLDLRDAGLGEGRVARSLLGHMPALFHRAGPDRYELFVFRSMTGTAVHEVERAMRGVAARG